MLRRGKSKPRCLRLPRTFAVDLRVRKWPTPIGRRTALPRRVIRMRWEILFFMGVIANIANF